MLVNLTANRSELCLGLLTDSLSVWLLAPVSARKSVHLLVPNLVMVKGWP